MAHDRPVALVNGVTGFLGLSLVRELTAGGWDLVALHRLGSDLKYLRRFPVRLAEAALEDPSSLERATPEGLDAVFHTAADLSSWRRHRDRQARANVDGTRHMVELALRRKVRKFVHTSTTGVYGLPREPFDESAPHLGLGSAFHYQHTKALAEVEVRAGVARGLDAVILNPGNIIGAFDSRSSWSRLIVLAATGKLPAVPPGVARFATAPPSPVPTSPPWRRVAPGRTISWAGLTPVTAMWSARWAASWGASCVPAPCRGSCCAPPAGRWA